MSSPSTSPSSWSAPARPGSPPRSSSPATASRSLLVEQRHAHSDLPRATVLSLRTMELLRSWGLHDAIVAGGAEVDWHMLECRTLAEAASGRHLQVGYPSRAQSAVLSPSAPECVAQDHLEPVLLEHLRSLAAAEVRMGTALAHVEVGPGGVTATLRDVDTGARAGRCRADWLIGGRRRAQHRPRRALGIAMHGCAEVFAGDTATFRAPLWEVVGPHRHGIYSITPPRDARHLPPGRRPRPLAGRLRRATATARPSGSRSSSGSARACPDLPVRGRPGRQLLSPPRRSRSATAPAAPSSPATPPIA